MPHGMPHINQHFGNHCISHLQGECVVQQVLGALHRAVIHDKSDMMVVMTGAEEWATIHWDRNIFFYKNVVRQGGNKRGSTDFQPLCGFYSKNMCEFMSSIYRTQKR
jgi:hypothetical protein